MKNILRNYSKLLILLVSVILISCGGSDVNIDTGDFLGIDGDIGLCDGSDTAFQVEEPFFDEVEAGSRFRLRLDGIGGDVNISGVSGGVATDALGDPDLVTITAVKRVR